MVFRTAEPGSQIPNSEYKQREPVLRQALLASEQEWQRAYTEINDFEAQLIDHGIVLAKYRIHITKDERPARFKVREQTPCKRWKFTDEVWRNRE